MSKYTSLVIISIITFVLLPLQAQVATNEWDSHMSYVEGQRLAISDNKVYTIASGSLFAYGINDNSLETYTKVNGLSDVYINDIAFSTTNQTLVICYDNGNIDLMSAYDIINIPDVKLKTIYGSKAINKVDVFDNIAYISTAFGILKLNIERAEISETYTLSNGEQNSVNGVTLFDDKIYAATDNGLYSADIEHINLQDFSAWTKESDISNPDNATLGIIVFRDYIVIAQSAESSTSIEAKTVGSSWTQVNSVGAFRSFGCNDEKLLISNTTKVVILNATLDITVLSAYNFTSTDFSSQNDIWALHAIPQDDNTYWIADQYSGLVQYSPSGTENFQPSGPATNTIWDIDIVQSTLRIAHGERLPDGPWTSTPGAVSTYSNNSWSYETTKTSIPSYSTDILSVVTDPLDTDHYYASAWRKGILEYQGRELIKIHNETNTTLVAAFGTTVISSYLVFDNDNNLWTTNSYIEENLHRMDADGNWSSFTPQDYDANITGEITFLSKGVKWITTPYWGKGILVHNDNETYDDESDDESKYFSIYTDDGNGSTEYLTDDVYDIALTNDGALWVGCNHGIAIYYNPDNVFESSGTPTASRISIPKNDGTGLADYLLADEVVQSIAVDGGNRKWLATANTGVMLVSSDGQDVLHHFTEDNSPLPSNDVRVVEINHETGEVFFGTSVGLVSFQADATEGNVDFSDIKVYPNPVRENFYGNITITGLVDETTVKITDVSGNLVNEVESNGGTAIWNGKNFYGDRVGTGVYLIFCSDPNGEQSGMTKVMVVN